MIPAGRLRSPDNWYARSRIEQSLLTSRSRAITSAFQDRRSRMARRSVWIRGGLNGMAENTGRISSIFRGNRGHFIGVATSLSVGKGTRKSRPASAGAVSQSL